MKLRRVIVKRQGRQQYTPQITASDVVKDAGSDIEYAGEASEEFEEDLQYETNKNVKDCFGMSWGRSQPKSS